MKQSLPSTMLTWHLTVLVHMSLPLLLMVLVAVRSLRSLDRMQQQPLLVVVLLLMDLLKLDHLCQLRPLHSYPWAIPSPVNR